MTHEESAAISEEVGQIVDKVIKAVKVVHLNKNFDSLNLKEAINYGEKSERIKLDDNLFKRRRWVRPADCVRTGDTVVTPNGEEYLLTKKITSEEKKIGGGSVDQRIYSEFVTIRTQQTTLIL